MLCMFMLVISPLRVGAIPEPEKPVALEVGQASGAREDTVSVPVYLDPGDFGVLKYSLHIAYDPAVLELAGKSAVTDEAAAISFAPVTSTSGVVKVEASNFGGSFFIMGEKQKVITLHFKIKKTAPSGRSNIAIHDSTYVEDEGKVAISTMTPGMVTVRDTAAVTIGSGSGSAGQTATVPVYLDSSSAGVGSYGMQIGFNPDVLEVSSVTGDSGERFISSFDNTGGLLSVAWADATGGDQPLSAGQKLFTIHFKVKATAAADDPFLLAVKDASARGSFSVTDIYGEEMMKTATSGAVTAGLTVTASNPAGANGKTRLSVTEAASGDNTFKYKNFARAAIQLPIIGESIGEDYALLPGDGLVAAANGDGIVIAEVNAADQVVRLGRTTAIVASPQGPDTGTGTGPVSAIPPLNKETITIHVENGGAGKESIVATTTISRTTAADGSKKDDVTFTLEQTNKSIEQLKAAGSDRAKIVIPDPKDEVAELNVTLPKASAERLAAANIDLEIFTSNVRIVIPNGSMQGLAEDAYFRVVPVKKADERKEIEQRVRTEQTVVAVAGSKAVTVIGRPMKIETNMRSGPVTLVLPLASASMDQSQLDNLSVFIEHSDGTKELVQGEIVAYDADGQQGIRLTVNKFSTFTIVHMDGGTQLQHKAYIQGYTDGSFGPDNSITRAEMAAILTRVSGEAEKQAGKVYTDVGASHWANDAIANVTKAGLMEGYPDGSFKPERTMTRAEIAKIVALMLTTTPSANGSFSDISGHWAQSAIELAKAAGILNGYQDGTFRPDQSLTRAETVVMISKLLGRAPLFDTAPKWSDVPQDHWAYGYIQEASTEDN